MEQVRVFIAVDVPGAFQGKLGSVVESLRHLPGEARWVSAPHLHFTLRFLGDISVSQLPGVGDTLREVAGRHRAFPLTVAGLGLFPERGAPSVVWLGVREGRAELVALQADLEVALERLGFAKEERPFAPHVTLARLRGAPPEPWRAATVAFGDRPVLSFAVTEVRVMKSELTRRGPIYSVLSASPLKTGEEGA
jgi:2'-5' RNA ligase